MSRRAPTWTCRRQSGGVKCLTENPNRFQKCQACQKRKPAHKKPAHMSALDLPYSFFVEANGGVDACGICGAGPSSNRKLDRDHSHEGVGAVRGVLCHLHNRALKMFNDDPALLRAAAEYLERPR